MRRSPQQQQQQSMDQIGLQSSSPYNELGLPKMASGNMRVYGGQPNSVYPTQDSLMIPGRMNPQINQLNVNTQQQISSPARSPQQSHQQISPNYGNQRSYGSPQQSPQNKQISQSQLQSQAQQQANERSLLQRCLEAPTDSLLRAALTQKTQGGTDCDGIGSCCCGGRFDALSIPAMLLFNVVCCKGIFSRLLLRPLLFNCRPVGICRFS
jgi:hypothetical protein